MAALLSKFNSRCLQSALSVTPVCAVDLGVHGAVAVAGGEDAVVGLGQDRGKGGQTGSPWPVEHLGLELGELVLQVGEAVGHGLYDAGVHGASGTLIRGPQILGA